jgi:hypothetical protein
MTTRKSYFRGLALFAFAALVVACSPQIYAVPMTVFTLNDGLGDVLTVDDAGGHTCAGVCSFITSNIGGAHHTLFIQGTLGVFDVNNTTARGAGAVIPPALINLNSINASATSSGDLTMQFSDYGYSNLTTQLQLSGSATLVGSSQSNGTSILFIAYGDAGNTPLALTSPIGSLGPFANVASAAATQTFVNPIGPSGSLTEVVTLHFTSAGEIDSGFTISNVPEPASLALLGGGLLVLAGTLRRKAKKAQRFI